MMPEDTTGLLLVTHGGSAARREAVRQTVAPLEDRCPVALAFGTAHPVTIRAGLEKLKRYGLKQAVAVRLFIDGSSFRHQAEFLLGLRADPPPRFVMHGAHLPDDAPLREDVHPERTIDHGMVLVHTTEGLLDAPQVGRVLVDRARTASEDPSREAVLLLAHGVADDARNDRWIAAMNRQADVLRALGFADVRAGTLREDWPEKRAPAERSVRAFVQNQSELGRRVLVLPYRLYGFGPYREVLAGLAYAGVEEGLLPHPAMTEWIEGQVEKGTAELARRGA